MVKKKTIADNVSSQHSSPGLIKYALLFVIFLSPLLRGLFTEPQFFTVSFLISVLFLVYLWKSQTIIFDKLDLLFLALVGSYALSIIEAVSLRESYLGFIRYLLYFLLFYSIRNNVISGRDKKDLANVYIATISVMTLLTLLTKAKIINITGAVIDHRLAGTVEYSNTYAVLLVTALVILLTIYGSEITVNTKEATRGVLLAYLNATALYATLSRGGFLIYLLMLAVIFLLSEAKIALVINLIIINVLAVVSSILIVRNEGIVILAVILSGGFLAIALKQIITRVPGKILRGVLVL